MKLRILLADDHEIVRRGLRALLEKHEGWEVCGEASDGREAIDKALQLNPDVIIVDVGMPNLNGLDTTRQLLQHDPHFKVIVLTITDSDQVIREALDAGARVHDLVAMNAAAAAFDLVLRAERKLGRLGGRLLACLHERIVGAGDHAPQDLTARELAARQRAVARRSARPAA